MAEQYDVAVLGGGSGGYVGAIRAAQLGLKVVLIEEDKVGGTCLHRGCIPTKALLQSAALLDSIAGGKVLGVTAGSVSFDFAAAQKNKSDVVTKLHRGIEYLLKKNAITVINGKGKISGKGALSVAGKDGNVDIAATNIIIATGSRVKSLPGLDIDGKRVITSDDALILDHIPTSAIIVGAGAVGVEFASMYRSYGVAVTLVEALDRLVPLEDEDVSAALQKSFEHRGITCLVGAQLDIASVQRNNDHVSVVVKKDGTEQQLSAEILLVATGRAANIESIGLENTAITPERGFIPINETTSTAEPNIYAVGDVVGGFQLAHKAMHEGVIAAEAIAGETPHPLRANAIPRTTYCTPQIASLGLSEADAKQQGRAIKVGSFPFKANGRALIWGEPEGLCKVIADAETDDVIGVHLIGHEVTELIAGPALGALLEVTPFELSAAIAPHPTLSEVLGEAALAVSGKAIHI